MNTSNLQENLKSNYIKHMERSTTKNPINPIYESSESFNMLLSSLFSQTVVKTLTAPLLRIRYTQQAAYESLVTKPKTLTFTEAYTRNLNRYS